MFTNMIIINISISYRSTYCNQRLKHLLSSLFASTFASRAVSSTDNKLQQSDNLDFKTLPFLTIQLVPIPWPPTAHKALDTSVLVQKGSPQTLHSSIPPGSSCREFSPPLRPPAGLQDGWGWGDLLPLVVMEVVVGQQIEIFWWVTNLVGMLIADASGCWCWDDQRLRAPPPSPPPIYHEFLLLGSLDFVDPLYFIRVW